MICLSLCGCKKWLDVQPSDQLIDAELFKDAQGFRHGLNGIYQKISGRELFGKNLTCGLYSALGQDYAAGKMGNNQDVAYNFNQAHPNSVAMIDEIWTNAYTAIANCNKLIKELKGTTEGLFPNKRSERNLIIGESMAIRALLHFELLRLYAPSPIQEQSGSYLPYVDAYPAMQTVALTSAAILDKITADLDSAQRLVAENDTITNRLAMSGNLTSLLAGYQATVGGQFFNYRMNRLNYVAINGLLARVYLYAGNYSKAKSYAKYVYDNFGPHGRLKWWNFTDEANAAGTHKYNKLADDLILAFYDADLITNIANQGGPSYRLSTDVDSWFPESERDYRKNFINLDESSIVSIQGKFTEKWRESLSTNANVKEHNSIIPALRMSEIYYIYSETLFREGQVNDALTVLNQVRQARGMLSTFVLTDETSYFQELISEYRREYLTEGQTVFVFKRLNRDLMRGTQIFQWT